MVCKEVVSAVVKEKRKRKIPFQVAKYAVGLDDLVEDFQSHCQRNGQINNKIIGIFGMGGSGKTTLAKDLFNRKHSEFSESTILFDVRERYAKGELDFLQSKLLFDLFRVEEKKIPSIEDGIAIIKDNLERSRQLRLLIVLDDVDNQTQLDALVSIDALNPNSLVIVTTRDERILIQAGVIVRYKMKEMNPEHSRELFCWHAFHGQSCKSGFEKLVDSFVKACGGLPLALRVMGGHVFGSDKAYWKSQLDEVEAGLHKDIKDRLKISYDALEEDQKQIFMDVACFFIGKDVSRAISIWKASGWRAERALQTLKDKCLVEVQFCFYKMDPDITYLYEPLFTLRMHDHLRDLGREMADNEMNHPRRLWRPEDLSGMRKIKGFQDILTGSEGNSFRSSTLVDDLESDFRMTYFVENSRISTYLQWLELHSIRDKPFIPEWIPLHNLQTLSLEGVSPARLWQRDDDQVPLKLKELRCCFEGRYFTGFTQHMFMRDLNGLVSSFGLLKNLESLHLEFGSEILKWNIEWNCLLKSLRELANLKTLELASFKVEGEFSLSNSGTTGYQFCMRSLEAITLCGAFKTRKVSIGGQSCPTLKSVKLYSMTDLIEVDLTGVTTLECLVLLKCGELRKVLANDLLNLEMFRIKLCRNMRQLPNFGGDTCLKKIYISRCWNLQDISAIDRLKGLKRIWIAYCPKLKNINDIEQLKGLKRIWLEECTKLQGVICLKELKGLKRIFIGGCPRLQEIEGIEFLIYLESIIITACPKLQNIRGIEELKGLKEMIIADSPIISCVERLQRLPWELSILVGRLAMSDSIADKIGGTLSMAYGFCEIDCNGNSIVSRKQVEEMIQSFAKTQHLLSEFIFCAMLDGLPCIGSDICNGTRIMIEYPCLRPIYLSRAEGQMIYMCVVNEERLSKYDSWMPSSHMWYDCSIKKAFLKEVRKGEESETLHILQSLFAQLSVGESEDYENADDEYDDKLHEYHDKVDGWYGFHRHDSYRNFKNEHVDYDDLAVYADENEEYADENEEYDGGDDD